MKRGFGRSLFLVAATLIAVVAVACGGGGDKKAGDQSAGANTPAAQAKTTEAKPTGGATTAAKQAPTAEATEAAADGGSNVDLSALRKLKSYRYKVVFAIQGGTGSEEAISFEQEGAWVAPDRSTAKCTGGFGPIKIEEEAITIGDKSWVKSDATGGKFQEGTSDTCSFTPEEMVSTFSASDLAGIKGSKETVNGVKAVRYDLDEKTAKDLLDLARAFGGGEDVGSLPPDLRFTFSIWLAEDGSWPVRALMDMSGSQDGQQFAFKIESNVTDVNDSGIKINPP